MRKAFSLDRRRLFRASGGFAAAGALGGCVTRLPMAPPARRLPPVHAEVDRLFDITVCLRPFRAEGPRIEAEHIGRALVVHNYGHGGSGWSLSWGSATMALRKALGQSPREIAVVGCGALGITTALLAQEAGAKVTIYARDWLFDARSARATGSWTPDSRIALTDKVAPGFGDMWEEMARISWKRYRRYLGLPGHPVEFGERYYFADAPAPLPPSPIPPLDFASYRGRLRDLNPPAVDVPPEQSPFPSHPGLRFAESLTFNIADYGHTLMSDFLLAGGHFERREFHSLAELGSLRETVVVNCTGYGARALCLDESIVPVRGQIAWLIPQPELRYGVFYKDVNVVPRRDGIVVQDLGGGDMRGYNDDNETIDRAEATKAVNTVAELFRGDGYGSA